MSRSFTTQSLAENNGQDDKPTYVAVDGKVYDVSKSTLWKKGAHMVRHKAGQDLTADLSAAPHGADVLNRDHIEEIGTLTAASADTETHLPGFLLTLLERHPALGRHPHPMTIHFPTSFLLAALIFTVINLVHPNWLGADFDMLATAMLVLGVISTPAAIATGLFAWWISYSLKMSLYIRYKLIFACVLVLAELTWIILKLTGASENPVGGWIVIALTLWLAINVGLLGHFGGQMVFPTKKNKRKTNKDG